MSVSAETSSQDSWQGQTLANYYYLQERLGQGGMGDVYRAIDQRSHEVVAVKILKSAGQDVHARRFQREFRLLARLSHQHVVRVLDYGHIDAEHPFLVMELLQGKELDEWWLVQPHDYALLHFLTTQVCQALSFIHNQGVVHRDIKPSNIMVLSNGEINVKLMDFGLARLQKDSTQITASHTVLGTVDYMAPEQIQGQAVDRRTDLYALGVILYQLVAGRLPFKGADMMGVLLQHLTAQPTELLTLVPDVPAIWQELIHRLLSKSPTERYQSAEEVLQALGNEPVAAKLPHLAPRADLIFESPMFGRLAELELGIAWLDVDSPAQLWLVAGDAGVGKSRLIKEVAQHAKQEGWITYTVEIPEASAISYQPFIDALRSIRKQYKLPVTSLWRPLLPLMPELAEPAESLGWAPLSDIGGSAAQVRIFNAISQILQDAAEQQPFLLFLDNLQWADTGTLSLLDYLLQQGISPHLQIGGGYRIEELVDNDHLARLLPAWKRQQKLAAVELTPLTFDDVQQMVMVMLGLSTPMPDLMQRVYTETEGNPFFVREVIEFWVETGELQWRVGQWVRRETGQPSIPVSVRDLIVRRLERLDEETKSALRTAAVIGVVFDFDVWLAVTKYDEDDLLDVLDELIRARLVEEVPSSTDRIAFSHHKVQDVIYHELTSRRRRRIHLKTADVLAKNKKSDPEEIARHYTAAHQWEPALDYTQRAIQQANEQYDAARSLRLCQQALEIIEHLPMPAFAQTKYEQLAETSRQLYYRGQFSDAAQMSEEAVRLAHEHQLSKGEANALLQVASNNMLAGNMDRVKPYLQQAGAIIEGLNDDELTIRLLQNWGRVWYMPRGEYDKAREVLLQSAEICRQINNHNGLFYALREAGNACMILQDLDESIRLHEESLAIVRQHGTLRDLAFGLYDMATPYFASNQYQKTKPLLQEVVDLNNRMEFYWLQERVANGLGLVLQALNEWDKAEEAFTMAVDAARRLNNGHLVGKNLCYLGNHACWLGQLTQAKTYYEEALELSKQLDDAQVLAYSHSGLIQVYVLTQQATSAEAHDLALASMDIQGFLDDIKIHVVAWRVRFAIAQGNLDGGQQLLDNLEGDLADFSEPRHALPLKASHALLAEARNETQEAQTLWQEVLTGSINGNLPYWQWSAHIALACLQLEQGHLAQGKKLLGEASAGIVSETLRQQFVQFHLESSP